MSSQIADAQDCFDRGASTIIHTNEIRAKIYQQAYSFWDRDEIEGRFQVPYQGPNTPSSHFAASLWIGGKDKNNNIRVVGRDYICEFGLGYFQGPLSSDQLPPAVNHKNWDRFFQVSGYSIENHRRDAIDGHIGDTIKSIFGWPGKGNQFFESINGFPLVLGTQGGAHFIEVDGYKNGIYEPQHGEYPHVYNLPQNSTPLLINWHVFNTAIDQFNSEEDGIPLLAEVQVTNYTMSCNEPLIDRTLFQQYRITLKGQSPFHDFIVSSWNAPIIGCHQDDYIGCSPARNTAYAYNQDEIDGIGTSGGVCPRGQHPTFEGVPPVQTITLLNQKMSSFIGYQAHPFYHFPPAAYVPYRRHDMYKYMQGKWLDNEPITIGNDGYSPGQNRDSTKFLYHDPPSKTNGWSAFQVGLLTGDKRILLSHEIDTFKPDQPLIIDVANTFHHSKDYNHLEQIDLALINVDIIQDIYNNSFQNCAIQQCDCDCVWPGDANHDGLVNYKDAIYIFMAVGDSGPARSDPFPFVPKDVKNWANTSFSSINSKYADTDGNGKINLEDYELWKEYNHQQNDCINHITHCPVGDEIYIYDQSADSIFEVDRKYRIDVGFQNINQIWGVSYQVKYDASLFHHVSSKNLINWKNNDVGQMGHIQDYIKGHHQGIIEGVLLNDQNNNEPLNNSRFNSFLQFTLKGKENSQLTNKHTEINICDVTVYYIDGKKEVLPSLHLKYIIPDSLVSSADQRLLSENIKLYPNPASQLLNIHTPANCTMSIINQLGKEVYFEHITKGRNRLNLSNVNSGIHLIRFNINGKRVTKKLIIHQ